MPDPYSPHETALRNIKDIIEAATGMQVIATNPMSRPMMTLISLELKELVKKETKP